MEVDHSAYTWWFESLRYEGLKTLWFSKHVQGFIFWNKLLDPRSWKFIPRQNIYLALAPRPRIAMDY
jgi:hypothetical protein